MKNTASSEKTIIKIFVSHRIDLDSEILENPLLIPIRCGAIYDDRQTSIAGDDTGNNISKKRNSFCELTVLYWMWKNVDADYYGLFHYRRYLSFSKNKYKEDLMGEIPCSILDDRAIEKFALNEATMSEIIKKYDVIVPRRLKLKYEKTNVYEQFCNAKAHHKEDLDKTLDVIKKKYPEYQESMEKYIKGDSGYYCNIFIMKKELFHNYCEWLFDILFDVEKQIDTSDYNMEESRVFGYLAERLFGIWFTYNLAYRNLKSLELQRTLFLSTERKIKFIPTKEDSIVIVMNSSNQYVPYLGVMLKSIVENMRINREYEIFVLTKDITAENSIKLRKIIEINKNISLKCVNVSQFNEIEKLYLSQSHISVESYYRLLIPLLFSNTKKVLYLDSDMIINTDLAELFDTDIHDYYIAAVKDIDVIGNQYGNDFFKHYLNEKIRKSPHSYFQAGCMLLNLDEMRKKFTGKEIIEIAQKANWEFGDQDVINYCFNEKILFLNQTWNTLMNWQKNGTCRMQFMKNAPLKLYNEYLEARKNPKIVHYAGYQKPWDTINCDFYEYFWKYARQTEFYEEILRRFMKSTLNAKNSKLYKNKDDYIYIKIVSLLKRIFGKTFVYKILRKIWHILKK